MDSKSYISNTGPGLDWRAYWEGAAASGAFGAGGTEHPVVRAFWHKVFESAAFSNSQIEIIDIASGDGAVLHQASEVIPAEKAGMTCIDISYDAVRGVMHRLPTVRGIVADALALPLADNCIDIAVSQFGIEYAGVDAVTGLLDAIKPGGQIALLMHYKSGAIFRECADNCAAIREVQKTGFVEGALEMFDSAFKVLAGGNRDNYERTSRALIPAFRAMESIMQQYGKHVAGGFVRRLYLDVDHIHSHLPRYNKADVEAWLKRSLKELESYAGRMSSMCEAAIDEESLQKLVDQIKSRGFTVEVAGALVAENLELPLGWSLVAKKGSR